MRTGLKEANEEVVLCNFVQCNSKMTAAMLNYSAVEGDISTYTYYKSTTKWTSHVCSIIYDCSQIYIVCCSYSHCVFTIKLVQTSNAAKPTCARVSRMSIFNLVGNERSTLMSGACLIYTYQHNLMKP